MLLLKELPTSKSLEKFVTRYPGTDISAISEFVSILRAASDISTALDALLAKHGLLQGRWWVLVLLLRQEDMTSSPSDLAEKAGVTKATMTGFIDGLEREGLVSRFLDTTDRRKFLIRLSVAGQKKLDEVMPEYIHCVTQFMNVLEKTEKRALITNLSTLASRVDLIR
jgi:DNA-binding MarR family transcriptional regulator